ncbi:MAG: rod shape-determining protein MreC [Dethiobacteria bacterium]
MILILILFFLSLSFFTGKFYYRYARAEDLLMTGLLPVQGFFSQVGSRVYAFFEGVLEYSKVLEENKRLKDELAAEQNLRSQLMELRKENHRLREMLGFKEQTAYTLLPAEVVARDPSQWFETITINKGYVDGVQKDMAVVTSQGLVGNVFFVSQNSSRVLMLTDSRRAVGALVQRSREPGFIGIIEGYPEKKGFLRMSNLSPEANIQPGDVVISSGLGGVFPKGLVIGHVVEVGQDQYGLLQQAIVCSAVNFNRLEEVFIVIESPVEEVEVE